jgi:hypothetical protein
VCSTAGEDYARFRAALLDELARAEIDVDVDHIDCGVLRLESAQLGLTNLARLCHAAPVEEWPFAEEPGPLVDGPTGELVALDCSFDDGASRIAPPLEFIDALAGR